MISMIENYQIRILMLMFDLEKLLGDIYAVFKDQFPSHAALWETLMKEEYEHADAVRSLYRMTYEKQVLFNEGTIKAEGIQSVIDYLKPVLENSTKGKYSAEKAVYIAYDIEKSLVEKDIFKHFDVSPKFEVLLFHLLEGSRQHFALIKKEYDKIQLKSK